MNTETIESHILTPWQQGHEGVPFFFVGEGMAVETNRCDG